MKLTKEERAEFRTEQKALKVEMKAAKKRLSKAKSVIKKETKRVSKTEYLIGKNYYRDHIRQETRYPEKYTRWCEQIKCSKQEISVNSELRDTMEQQINTTKLELKLLKQAQKKGYVPEIVLE